MIDPLQVERTSTWIVLVQPVVLETNKSEVICALAETPARLSMAAAANNLIFIMEILVKQLNYPSKLTSIRRDSEKRMRMVDKGFLLEMISRSKVSCTMDPPHMIPKGSQGIS